MRDTTMIILLADDDPEDQEMLQDSILEQDPAVQLKKVDSGKQAVDYLLACPDATLPSLIILDYSMPVYNAAEILSIIGKEPRLKPIPKLVWSTSKQPEHVNSCIEKGAMFYFVKPNKLSELTDIARKMLEICHASAGK